MPSVDNRVVKMTFDNAEFERRVQSTIKSLQDLDKATQFKGAHKGFTDLDASAKKINFDKLSKSATDVDKSFKFTGATKAMADLSADAGKVNLTPVIDQAGEVDKAFQFAGAQKGLADLSKASGEVNMAQISDGADEAGSGIGSFAVGAIAAIGGVATAATALGGILASKIAGGPIADGFSEFETNMGSIQTILANTASKGSTLDDVTHSLDQLNTYSDKTIYNFSEMAKNIGTFTAAGVDLKTSVQSIKGIANLAALSGSSSEQASTAMYQLSQAIASGSVKLMDWNSVVNAGMGGELFKNALFETGKALNTLTDVPVGQTMKQWTDAGNNFRDSLKDGWITSDVLTTTLAGMSGDLTSTQLQIRGFSKEAADNLVKLGAQGQEAATSVKTLSQLLSTVKEALGTQWADSFRAIFGNFNEAKQLFTNMNNFIGGFITRAGDARNKVLLQWKNTGGRLLLLLGLKNVVQDLLAIIDPIRRAFRDLFPKRTAEDLNSMTRQFYRFSLALKPSHKTVTNLHLIFRLFFGVLKAGWLILSGTIKLFFGIGKAIFSLVSGPNLSGLANFTQKFMGFVAMLTRGGGIVKFFDGLQGAAAKGISAIGTFAGYISKALSPVFSFLGDVVDAVGRAFLRFGHYLSDTFGKFDFKQPKVVADSVGRVQTRFEMLVNALKTVGRFFASLWDPLKQGLGVVGDVLDNIGHAFTDFFSNLGDQIAKSIGKGDFSGAIDIINVGLLGGITAALYNFSKNGLKFDFDFGGGILKGFKEKLEPLMSEFTNTLKTLQLQVKAEAIMKIAKAVAVLAASMFVLSLIDSDRLGLALGAVVIGMGAMMVAMGQLNKMKLDLKGAGKMALLVFALNGLGTALISFSIAVAIFGKMKTKTLVQGMGAVIFMLAAMVTVAKQMKDHTEDFFISAAGLTVMAIALTALSGVIILLGHQDIPTLAKGMIGMGAAMAILVFAMKQMPKGNDSAKAGIGMLFLGYAIKKIADAMKVFATLSITELAKGIVTLAITMRLLVNAVNDMPVAQMLEVGLGMLAIAGAMFIMAKAMQEFGSMKLDEIGKALGTLALTMLILVVAVNAMSEAAVGVVSLVVVAASLLILAKVLQIFAAMSFSELGMALIGVAAALTVIALAASAITATGAVVAIGLLGIALIGLGAGMVLVGGGVYLLARGLQMLADAGSKGIAALGQLIQGMIKYIPQIVKLAKDFILGLMTGILSGMPQIIALGVKIGGALLDGLAKLVPKAILVIKELVTGLIKNAQAIAPEFIKLGFIIITNFLQGLDENIGEIVTRGVSIVKQFLGTLAEHAPELATMGAFLLIRFLEGITENAESIVEAVLNLITTFLNAIASNIQMVVAAGLNIITNLLIGIAQGAVQIVATVTILILQFISALNTSALLLIAAGTQMILNIIAGITVSMTLITAAVGGMILTFIAGISAQAQAIIDAGGDMIIKIIKGIGDKAQDVIDAAVTTAEKFLSGLTANAINFAYYVGNMIHTILTAIRHWVDTNGTQIDSDMLHVAGAILNGLTGGIASKAGGVVKAAMEELASHMPGWMKKILGIKSPSTVFAEIGGQVVDGLAVGVKGRTHRAEGAVTDMGTKLTTAMQRVKDLMTDNKDFNPTITPVLDLTNVHAGAGTINKLMDSAKLSPSLTSGHAQVIQSALTRQNGSGSEPTAPVVHDGPLMQQIINAPRALSTAEIYKNTRNQIAMTKKKLEIP